MKRFWLAALFAVVLVQPALAGTAIYKVDPFMLLIDYPKTWSGEWQKPTGDSGGNWIFSSSDSTAMVYVYVLGDGGSDAKIAADFAEGAGAGPVKSAGTTMLAGRKASKYLSTLMAGEQNDPIPLNLTMTVLRLDANTVALFSEATLAGLAADKVAVADRIVSTVKVKP